MLVLKTVTYLINSLGEFFCGQAAPFEAPTVWGSVSGQGGTRNQTINPGVGRLLPTALQTEPELPQSMQPACLFSSGS